MYGSVSKYMRNEMVCLRRRENSKWYVWHLITLMKRCNFQFFIIFNKISIKLSLYDLNLWSMIIFPKRVESSVLNDIVCWWQRSNDFCSNTFFILLVIHWNLAASNLSFGSFCDICICISNRNWSCRDLNDISSYHLTWVTLSIRNWIIESQYPTIEMKMS